AQRRLNQISLRRRCSATSYKLRDVISRMEENEIEQNKIEIRELALTVVREFTSLAGDWFGFNAKSVEWVEGFIERDRTRRDLSQGVPAGLVNAFGSFLGECVVASSDGEWEWMEDRGDWGIRFRSGSVAFPFVKVSKQFSNGLESGDSITSFYRISIEYVAEGKLG